MYPGAPTCESIDASTAAAPAMVGKYYRAHGAPATAGAGVSTGSAPYGPETPRIRRFLVRLAALGAEQRAEVVTRHVAVVESREWQRAELRLATIMVESGRTDLQEAFSGPLLQLVGANPSTDSPDAEPTFDAIAEPALAAVLALLVRDLLDTETFTVLYEPFALAIPAGALEPTSG
jgi:hypothetical protein